MYWRMQLNFRVTDPLVVIIPTYSNLVLALDEKYGLSFDQTRAQCSWSFGGLWCTLLSDLGMDVFPHVLE